MTLVALIGTGLVAGSLHVVAGPDHLAALAPVSVHAPSRSIRLGALWGLGHGIGVVVIGVLGIAASEALDLNAIGGWSEFLVGIILVLTGLWALRRATGLVVHQHAHFHEDDGHVHGHLHVHSGEDHSEAAHAHHTHAVLGVGMFHGAAGAGHLFGVLPALALEPSQAAVYMASYLAAAVASMAAFGGALGTIARRSGQRAMRAMMSVAGGAALAVGCVWMVSNWPA